MAILSKEAYEKKALYAARIMRENRDVECNLTEDHRNAIEVICAIRHRIHSNPHADESMFFCGSSDYDELWRTIGTVCNENEIIEIIAEAGLPELDWTCNEADYITDADEIYGSIGEMSEDQITDEIFRLRDLIECWNKAIETWLKKIDNTHGTHYCPTGKSRIF